jgi:hypothetical protein
MPRMCPRPSLESERKISGLTVVDPFLKMEAEKGEGAYI